MGCQETLNNFHYALLPPMWWALYMSRAHRGPCVGGNKNVKRTSQKQLQNKKNMPQHTCMSTYAQTYTCQTKQTRQPINTMCRPRRMQHCTRSDIAEESSNHDSDKIVITTLLALHCQTHNLRHTFAPPARAIVPWTQAYHAEHYLPVAACRPAITSCTGTLSPSSSSRKENVGSPLAAIT